MVGLLPKMCFVGGLVVFATVSESSGDEARLGSFGRLPRKLRVDQRRLFEEMPVDPQHDALCTATTLYAFIGDSIPLWDLWREYFRSCDDDVVIRVAARRHHLRFNYAMVDVMFDLADALRDSVAPNGCAPRWIHFLSTSCAPIVPCEEMRGRLRRHQGQSFIDTAQNFSKSSQWITLWAPHALALERERDAIRASWTAIGGNRAFALSWSDDTKHKGAYDEFVFVHEAHSRGMSLTGKVLTFSMFSPITQDGVTYEPEHPQDYNHGPSTWSTDDPAKLAPFIRHALEDGRVFFRKVYPGAAPFFLRHLRNFSGYPTDANIASVKDAKAGGGRNRHFRDRT